MSFHGNEDEKRAVRHLGSAFETCRKREKERERMGWVEEIERKRLYRDRRGKLRERDRGIHKYKRDRKREREMLGVQSVLRVCFLRDLHVC